jgi:hypothetical protein
MRRLRRRPARVCLRVSLALLAPLALAMILTGCAEPAPALSELVDTQPSGVGAAAIAATPYLGQDQASPPMLQWFTASANACSDACLSATEQDAIVARAIAEHEMRRP